MTRDEVDAFFAAKRRSLPAPPTWDDGNREGEMRAIPPLAVAQDGVVCPIRLTMTVRVHEREYLVAMLMAGSYPICRLCMTTPHRDPSTGELVTAAHFHDWERNRPPSQALRKKLNSYELVPNGVVALSDAFAWFLKRNRIDSPPWLPVAWPHGKRLV